MTGDSIKLGEGQTLRIVASSADALELESTWTSGQRKPQRHYHPRQEERFEVLAGQLTVELGSDPPRVTPGLRTEEMFRFIDKGMSPLRVATLLWEFRHEFRLALRR